MLLVPSYFSSNIQPGIKWNSQRKSHIIYKTSSEVYYWCCGEGDIIITEVLVFPIIYFLKSFSNLPMDIKLESLLEMK